MDLIGRGIMPLLLVKAGAGCLPPAALPVIHHRFAEANNTGDDHVDDFDMPLVGSSRQAIKYRCLSLCESVPKHLLA